MLMKEYSHNLETLEGRINYAFPFAPKKNVQVVTKFIKKEWELHRKRMIQKVSNLTYPSINSPTERAYDEALADVLKILSVYDYD